MAQFQAGNISGYISEEVITKALSKEKNKQREKWVDQVLQTKKAFDILESSKTKTNELMKSI